MGSRAQSFQEFGASALGKEGAQGFSLRAFSSLGVQGLKQRAEGVRSGQKTDVQRHANTKNHKKRKTAEILCKAMGGLGSRVSGFLCIVDLQALEGSSQEAKGISSETTASPPPSFSAPPVPSRLSSSAPSKPSGAEIRFLQLGSC